MPILRDHPLHNLNTFGLPCQAAGFVYLEDSDQLQQLVQSSEWNDWADKPRLILGGGSNLLLCEDFAGLVIQVALRGIMVSETDDDWLLHVAAGENWHQLVEQTLQQGMPGLENLALIPGTAGAAPIQNIGAYGSEFADFCDYVEYVSLSSGKLHRLSAEDCRFGYRDSIFKRELSGGNFLITAVGLRLNKQWQPSLKYRPLQELFADQPPAPEQIFDAVCTIRQSKLPDPRLLGNAGSFFKNPVLARHNWQLIKQRHPEMPGWETGEDQIKVPAGWLIDKAGLKGYRLGRAGVHKDQALVLVNHGQAEASEVIALASHVMDTVQARYGITLSPEVRFIGASGEISASAGSHAYNETVTGSELN